MRVRSYSLISIGAGILLVGFTACGPGEEQVLGECQTVFDGEVCTWGTVVGNQVTEFGIEVPLTAVQNAPLEQEMVFPPQPVAVIALPDQVAEVTGFDHLGLDWEPHGHPPALFMTPHFDFHFYTVTPDRVEEIDCTDNNKPSQLPAGYTLPDIEIPGLGELVGLCVPQMGMHAMLEAELDQTEPFGAAMIVGYYQQDLIFLEPMISRAKLLTASSFDMEVPTLPDAGDDVTIPAAFSATYDEEARSYRFVFSGL